MRYHACAHARDVVLSWPNPFEAVAHGLPEDICFYRRGEVWFATVTHERLAEARLDTAGDAALFQPLDSAGWDYDERRRILDEASVKSAAPRFCGAALCRWKAAQNAAAGTRPPE